MTINLTDKTIGIWFMQVTDDSDYMGSLSLDADHGRYMLDYRFRYYRGDQNLQFEKSQDAKNWYRVKMDAQTTKREAIEKVRMVIGILHAELLIKAPDVNHEIFEVLNNTFFDDFVRRFMQQPWTRAKWTDVKGVDPVEIREED